MIVDTLFFRTVLISVSKRSKCIKNYIFNEFLRPLNSGSVEDLPVYLIEILFRYLRSCKNDPLFLTLVIGYFVLEKTGTLIVAYIINNPRESEFGCRTLYIQSIRSLIQSLI